MLSHVDVDGLQVRGHRFRGGGLKSATVEGSNPPRQTRMTWDPSWFSAMTVGFCITLARFFPGAFPAQAMPARRQPENPRLLTRNPCPLPGCHAPDSWRNPRARVGFFSDRRDNSLTPNS